MKKETEELKLAINKLTQDFENYKCDNEIMRLEHDAYKSMYQEESNIVNRIWRILGDSAKGKSLYEAIEELIELRKNMEKQNLNELARVCHEANINWWKDPATEKPLVRNKGELMMLMVSEIAEAMEGERKNLMDDKLPHRRMSEVELADCLIRIFDYAGGFGLDLNSAFWEKMEYNANRVDHTLEHRRTENGKKF